jgi:5-methylcytosine-specific restriction endonuclease McrA
MRRWRQENPEAEREARRRYRANNLEAVRAREREKTYARRAKQAPSPALAALMEDLLTQPCVYCGSTEDISIDHIEPLSRGGKHEADNLAPACLPCNCSKNNQLPSEWDGRLGVA